MTKTILLAAAFGLAAPLTAAAQVPPSAPAPVPTDRIDGELPDGTRWAVQMPAKWNGTLVLDLDGAGFRMPAPRPGGPPQPPQPTAAPYNAYTQWLLARGYAYGGITREPVGYDFPRAVDYLVGVRDRAAAKWGSPKRVLLNGGSRGAFAVRMGLELKPEVFAGGLLYSGGGAGEIAVLNNKLNGVFVLKTLVDPASAMTLVNVDTARETAALAALVDKAKATPQGRARLALAAAVQQFALWSSRDKPRPAPGDHDAALDQIADAYVFATAVPVRAGVERIAGGNVSWNTGVDYARLLDISGRRAMVEALYAKAGLSLAADLATLRATPRISADAAAVRRAEPKMTYSGRIRAPIVDVDNDDPVDPASDKLVYLDTLKAARTDGLFRLIWSDQPGHGGQTNLDRAVGFTLLERRLQTGRWPDTSLPALKRLAAEVAAASPVDLGQDALFEPAKLPAPAGRWDARDWGRYRGR